MASVTPGGTYGGVLLSPGVCGGRETKKYMSYKTVAMHVHMYEICTIYNRLIVSQCLILL